MTKLVVLFAAAPAAHWTPRFVAGGVDAVAGDVPTVTADGVVEGLASPQGGVVYLINARVAGVMTFTPYHRAHRKTVALSDWTT